MDVDVESIKEFADWNGRGVCEIHIQGHSILIPVGNRKIILDILRINGTLQEEPEIQNIPCDVKLAQMWLYYQLLYSCMVSNVEEKSLSDFVFKWRFPCEHVWLWIEKKTISNILSGPLYFWLRVRFICDYRWCIKFWQKHAIRMHDQSLVKFDVNTSILCHLGDIELHQKRIFIVLVLKAETFDVLLEVINSIPNFLTAYQVSISLFTDCGWNQRVI